MTDLVTVALIGTCGVIFSAMMQFVTVVKVNRIQATAIRNEVHAESTALVVQKTQADVVDLKLQTDGITAALVAVTARAEHAKGKLEGIAEEKKSNGAQESENIS